MGIKWSELRWWFWIDDSFERIERDLDGGRHSSTSFCSASPFYAARLLVGCHVTYKQEEEEGEGGGGDDDEETTLWKVDFYGKFFSFLAAFWGHLGIRVNILPFGILWDLLGSFGILSRVGHIRWGLQSFWDSLGSFGILHRGRHGIVGFLGHSFRIVRDRLGYFGMFHRWRCELKESTGFRGIF